MYFLFAGVTDGERTGTGKVGDFTTKVKELRILFVW
jgi:hypothetical protein